MGIDDRDSSGSGKKAKASKTATVALPYRPFRDRPSGSYVESIIQQLSDHAQPEIIESLFRNAIPKDVEFFILRKDIVLDGKKRPKGDHAPCPMCTPNRFLTGSFVWIPSMQCCAVIGHCCADKETQARAEREYKQRMQREYEETYLLQCLPLVEARMQVLTDLKPAAQEALRLFRRFRSKASLIHDQLRRTKHQFGGHLKLSEVIRGGENDEERENDYFGPRGFRGRGSTDIETREHDYGILSGELAVITDYNPVKELEHITRQLASVHALPTEEAAIEFICAITEQQRHAGVVIMEGVDSGVAKFAERLREFVQFFSRENVERLNAFGISPHNPRQFQADFEILHGRPCLTLVQDRAKCVLHVGSQFERLNYAWPKPNT